jgi:hypothetical protein
MSLYPKNSTTQPPKRAGQELTDFDAAFEADPPAAPSPRPPDGASLLDHAVWLHSIGVRVSEDQPRSKHAAKHFTADKGHRDDLYAIKSRWSATPDANVAIRCGASRRVWVGEDLLCIHVLDADGPKARQFVESVLQKAGTLATTPTVEHGDGAKFVFRGDYGGGSARLMVPGCKNEKHDGLELLAAGKKATAFGT